MSDLTIKLLFAGLGVVWGVVSRVVSASVVVVVADVVVVVADVVVVDVEVLVVDVVVFVVVVVVVIIVVVVVEVFVVVSALICLVFISFAVVIFLVVDTGGDVVVLPKLFLDSVVCLVVSLETISLISFITFSMRLLWSSSILSSVVSVATVSWQISL